MIDPGGGSFSFVRMSVVNGQPAAAEARLPVRVPAGAARDLLLLALLWAGSLCLVNPLGNFPLNDDWSFGTAVKHLLEKGEFRPTGWTSMPLISQTLWGALFCLPAGFSFTALRFSTLFMSLGGVLAVYLLVRQAHPSRPMALLIALSVAFNPLYFALANTFMTDSFFTALMVMSAICFRSNLRTGSDMDLLGGTSLALAATLCRQLGVAVPLAYGICVVCRDGLRGKVVLRAMAPVGVCALALVALQHWLRVSGRLPALYSVQNDNLLSYFTDPIGLAIGLPTRCLTALLYLGWFSLPVLLLVHPSVATLRRHPRSFHIAACAGGLFFVGAGLVLTFGRGPMPFAGNVLLPQGIGPLMLRDTQLLGLPHVRPLWPGFWYAVTAASLCGGAMLVASIAWLAADDQRPPLSVLLSTDRNYSGFFLLCAALYLLPILVIGGWDRYYLPALPFLLAGAVARASAMEQRLARFKAGLAGLLLICLSGFSVLATRDYLAWNRVRWQALNELTSRPGVSAEQIDGGFEFNGYYLYDPLYKPQKDKSGWWVRDDAFLLSFGEMAGWRSVKEYRYHHWLPSYEGRVLVLQKEVH